ncbi:hypothetical protein PPL_04741 [Heterostelium album PN500]|uniref:Cyclin N-terminal domain-containing protein n=1 Tax=Heterostelium pallidum (strain ATCC 26659 / Pp 5 / PN500) TaxID=670386 RepID=D3B8E8_HETP5|nr:hypothetical protein PPL_04741 [Heterostelium album PN500]EFA82316.1 hypothetical protein PPL_04741 [Heterostelium album PN500]|eukprot:XP_020434433.1 hypothetical protein PPL_04741 [Heterostelium album PN500]
MSSVNQRKRLGYQKMFKTIYDKIYGVQKSTREYYVLAHRVYEWLLVHDPNYTKDYNYETVLEAIQTIFEFILGLLDMFEAPPSLLRTVIYYSEKYVSKVGIIHNEIFNLILMSTIVSLKFWPENIYVENIIFADIFEIPNKDINIMERNFLTGVNYHLNIKEEDVNSFLSSIDYESKSLTKKLTKITTSSYPNPTRHLNALFHFLFQCYFLKTVTFVY